MFPGRSFIAYLLFALVLNAQAGVFSPDKLSWDEDVLMSNGQQILVQRTILVQFDAKPTIRFTFNGEKIKWNVDGEWPLVDMPDILDVVNGMPVVLVPVRKWWGCRQYAFPKEQLVAFGYKGGRWDRIDVAGLPKELKVNLVRAMKAADLKYWYKDKHIPISAKLNLDGPRGDSVQGDSLTKIIESYSRSDESCLRMRPPEPAVEQVLQRGAAVERTAPTLAAEVRAVTNTPETITRESLRLAQGRWSGVGYIGPSCNVIVEGMRNILVWTGDQKEYKRRLVGYELNVRTSAGEKGKIQVWASSDAMLETLVCDQRSIIAVKRENKGGPLIIHRFDRGGDLIDVYRITLPDAPGYKYGTRSPWLWTVALEVKDELLITLIDYNDPVKSRGDPTIEQKAIYTVKLPPI